LHGCVDDPTGRDTFVVSGRLKSTVKFGSWVKGSAVQKRSIRRMTCFAQEVGGGWQCSDCACVKILAALIF